MSLQVAKLEVKDIVVAEPVRSLPRAELVVMQVCRLRPKSTEECRIETADIVAWTAYLRGEVPPAPGAPKRQWPVNLNMDYYLTPKGMILSCKVCPTLYPIFFWLHTAQPHPSCRPGLVSSGAASQCRM